MLNENLKEGATRLPARRWLLLLLLGAGLLFLIFGSLFPQDKDESERLDVEEYKASLTQEVTALCERVDGAGEVALVIHFKGTEEYVYATDNNKSGKESDTPLPPSLFIYFPTVRSPVPPYRSHRP